jgi:predicted dehydrogenase
MDYILKAIEHNVDALIEKPLVSNYQEIVVVEAKLRGRKNKICVGFNLRFHPIVQEICKIITANKYGKVLKADLYVGEYLPFWHPYEDYRSSYAARKELGGGALRTLCHEIDMGQYWFGDYGKIFSKVSKISDLVIDADDSTDILAEMKNGSLLKISMDYLNPVIERRGRILFQKGLLEYNFTDMEITFTDYATQKHLPLLKLENYDYNDQYRRQMEAFISKSNQEICTLEEGINVSRIIDKCEQSSRLGRMLNV